MRNKNLKTKKLRGVDLSANCFCYVGHPERPATWLLPINGFSQEFTRQLIQRSLDNWEVIADHIPVTQLQRVRWQLEGAAQSHGIPLPQDLTVTEAEMELLTEAMSFSERMIRLADLDSLFN
jgi:hypothetical protein